MERNVELCERGIGYTFKNKRQNAESLNMSGNPIYFEGQFVRIPKNTRLAVYGDSVAAALLCRKWVHTSLTKGSSVSKEYRIQLLLWVLLTSCKQGSGLESEMHSRTQRSLVSDSTWV